MQNSKAALIAGALAVALPGVGAARAAPPSLEITDAVARVIVVPEAREDIKVELISTHPELPLRVRQEGRRTVIDGALTRGRIRACRGAGEGASVLVANLGEVAWRDLPQIVVRTPRAVTVRAGGAVFGVIGRSGQLEFGSAGCGAWTIGDVAGDMRIIQAGSGDTRTGAAGSARLRTTGAGDIATAEIRNGLTAEIAGAGDINVAGLRAGPFTARVAGSGDVHVRGGRAGLVTASVAGSGNIYFAGKADSLKARITGAGDIRVGEVNGRATKAIIGAGQVRIGR